MTSKNFIRASLLVDEGTQLQVKEIELHVIVLYVLSWRWGMMWITFSTRGVVLQCLWN